MGAVLRCVVSWVWLLGDREDRGIQGLKCEVKLIDFFTCVSVQ